ncbi:MAG: VirB8/TrbF family protein [Bacilli bacterium]|nr:VirB8/TrbF family protein [Bacilli bacterium]
MNKEEINPFLAARREWNERYGSYIKSASTWRLIAFLLCIITIIAISGLAYSASQNKHIPYIIEVDKLGTAVAVAPAKQIETQDERVVKHALAEFTSNYRSVYGDKDVQKEVIFKAYRYLLPSSPAYFAVTEYYKQNSPFQRMETERVSVEILSVIKISPTTWQIDWKENKSDAQGHLNGIEFYKGAATLKFIEPKNENEIFKNPTGLWVSEFSWQKILK